MSCSVGGRCSSGLALLWLWRRLAAVAPIGSLAWELPYAAGAALKRQKTKRQKDKKTKKKRKESKVREIMREGEDCAREVMISDSSSERKRKLLDSAQQRRVWTKQI